MNLSPQHATLQTDSQFYGCGVAEYMLNITLRKHAEHNTCRKKKEENVEYTLLWGILYVI